MYVCLCRLVSPSQFSALFHLLSRTCGAEAVTNKHMKRCVASGVDAVIAHGETNAQGVPFGSTWEWARRQRQGCSACFSSAPAPLHLPSLRLLPSCLLVSSRLALSPFLSSVLLRKSTNGESAHATRVLRIPHACTHRHAPSLALFCPFLFRFSLHIERWGRSKPPCPFHRPC